MNDLVSKSPPNPDHIPFSNSKTCPGPDEALRSIPRRRQRSKKLDVRSLLFRTDTSITGKDIVKTCFQKDRVE
jgi:hypothetical protein